MDASKKQICESTLFCIDSAGNKCWAALQAQQMLWMLQKTPAAQRCGDGRCGMPRSCQRA